MDRKSNSLSERDRLKSEFSEAFNQLRVEDNAEGIKISVPNGSRFCTVSLNDGIYTVATQDFKSTYKRLDEAIVEVLECLVCRELYDNNFDTNQINFVVTKLIR